MMRIEYPVFEYNGDIKYCKEFEEISKCSKDLLKWVNHQDKKVPISFKIKYTLGEKGAPRPKTSLIQLCLNTEICYLFHVSTIRKLPESLVQLLGHKNVILHSNVIIRQINQLKKDFGLKITCKSAVTLGKWCNTVCGTTGIWNLEELANYRCKKTIHKPCENLSISNWDELILTEDQKKYAAKDVVIGQAIYDSLEQRSKIVSDEHDEYKEKRKRYQELTPKQKFDQKFDDFLDNFFSN